MKIVKWSAEPAEPKLVLQCRGAGAFSVSGTRSPPYPQTRDFSSEGASSGPWENRVRDPGPRIRESRASLSLLKPHPFLPQECPRPRVQKPLARARWESPDESPGLAALRPEGGCSYTHGPGLCPSLPQARRLAASRSARPAPEPWRSTLFPLILSLMLNLFPFYQLAFIFTQSNLGGNNANNQIISLLPL